MIATIEKINALAEENGFPYSRVKEINDTNWWKSLIQHFDMETIYTRLEQSYKSGDFNFTDTHFYYDTEMQHFFSFHDNFDLKTHFNL